MKSIQMSLVICYHPFINSKSSFYSKLHCMFSHGYVDNAFFVTSFKNVILLDISGFL